MIPVTNLRTGVAFSDAQGLWEVISYRHVKMGRGSATIRIKVRNLKTDSVIEKTFTSGQKIEDIEIEKKKGQFLYSDASEIVFMDPATFEQFTLSKTAAGGKEKFLKEGQEYDIQAAGDSVLGIEIPKIMVLEVAETAPGVKGDTVSAATKEAVLENGLKVKVPLFIDQGDKLKIDTRTNNYVERAKS